MSSSRGIRKDRSAAFGSTSSEESQLWQQVRSQMKVLEKAHSTYRHQQEESEKRKAALASTDDSAADAERQALASILLKLKQSTSEELNATEGAIESLGILTALRSSSENESAENGAAGGVKRKKRRGEELSPSPVTGGRGSSPQSRSNDTTAASSSYEATPSRRAAAGPGVASSGTPSSSGSVKTERPAAAARRSTISSRDGTGPSTHTSVDPARARREALFSQLPLAKGRKVAFHQPSKSSKSAGGSAAAALAAPEDDSDTWILAIILECIHNDKNRYVVQDVEIDDVTHVAPTFNTTLKALVPLPESVATLPERDYAVGTEVMALYPDTSCFYRAVVKGGGPRLESVGRKQREKRAADLLEAKYQIEFEDDGGDIKSVAAYLVVERP
ncbi:hypothetical protein BDZ90DRAFT_234339 [Jaminaea rosea]|uniref:SGF29 C-terminal domain-containing protein n=1 Tax=Jaminaea rosea TaxID=1569628 RepID=A0A316UPR3_9BASI|nr:hypothetical protein BDZ90DRAFT_234339 [Jaminaea rosea]PWN25125.1 hypothetical protein BDZ90DRAFT_234339 [Jaminaea rosea]